MYLAGRLFLRIPILKNWDLIIIVLMAAEVDWLTELRSYIKGMRGRLDFFLWLTDVDICHADALNFFCFDLTALLFFKLFHLELHSFLF